jgi:dienelactone hydrolase
MGPDVTSHLAQRVTFPGNAGQLAGHLYSPPGKRAGPGIVLNHGSELQQDTKPGVGHVLAEAGYRVLVAYRRGYGESEGQSRIDAVPAPVGTEGHGEQVCARLSAEAEDVVSAVAFLRTVDGVDPTCVSVMGSSYGGITSILSTGLDTSIRACVSFAAAAMSWGPVPEIHELLLLSIDAGKCPVLMMQASNDFDLTPSEAMSARCQASGRDHERVIFPPFGANEMEAHRLWTYLPQVWAPIALRFLAQVNGRAD